jgi:hypothetical protein
MFQGVGMKKFVFFTLLVIAIPAAAQTSQKDILLKHWKTSSDFTIAIASAMPAEGYTFRPPTRVGSRRLLCQPKSRSG